jgi:hypothetical protein
VYSSSRVIGILSRKYRKILLDAIINYKKTTISMNRHTKFLKFLEAICDEKMLYATIKHGYYTCMESIMTNVGENTWNSIVRIFVRVQ